MFAMAYGLLGVDIVLRLALIEKKVAVRWRKTEAAETAETAVVSETEETARGEASGLDAVQAAASSPESKHMVSGQECQLESNKREPLDDDDDAQASPPKTWTARLPPIVTLLASRRLDAALFGCLVQAALLTSFDSILPLYVEDIFGWDSIGAGLIFLPLTLPAFASPVVGWLSDRYGPRWLATVGFVLAVPPLVLLRLVTHDSLRQKALLCALLAVIGITLNLILTPLMAEISYAVTAKADKRPPGFFGSGGAYAQAYGLFNMAFAGGSMAGPLLAGLVKQRAGWGTTTLVLACVSAVSALPTLIWSGGSISKQRKARRKGEDAESVCVS